MEHRQRKRTTKYARSLAKYVLYDGCGTWHGKNIRQNNTNQQMENRQRKTTAKYALSRAKYALYDGCGT